MNAAASPRPDARAYPLTEAQSGLWYAQRLDPGNPVFNTAHALWIDGPLDVAAFTAAVDQAAAESDALALRMREDAGGPQQWVEPSARALLQVVDLSAAVDPDAEARKALRRDLDTPRDPTRDPLSAQCLFVLGAQRHVWYLRVHHLAIDGYGMALLSDRVAELYAVRLRGGEAGPALAPWKGVLDEDAAYRGSDKRNTDAAWWRERLHGMPEVASLAPGRAQSAQSCHHLIVPLDAAWRQRLMDLSARVGLPWPDVLTALTAAYVQRMTGAAEATIGVPFMGRLGSASARVPAMVMNVLPLRVSVPAQTPLEDVLRGIARELVQSRRRGRYRSEQLRRDLGLLGGQRRLHGPLVNVQPFYRPTTLHGATARLEVLRTGPVDDLTLGFRGDGQQLLDLEIEANPHLYSAAAAQAHAERLAAFLDATFDAASLDEVPLASPAEAQRYLFDVNATAHALPDATLVDLIEATMARTPAAVALEFEGQTLDYAALDRRSAALAAQLRAAGAGRDRLVAVALPRSLELVVALVAVLRAGAAYLPLDLSHPPERLAKVLQAASPVLALALPGDAAALSAHAPVLATDAWNDAADAAADIERAQPGDAAYVIYTSGSTGEPKGVLVEHRAIVNRLEWMRVHYGVDAGDRIVQKTPATFDVSVWEFFLPLLAGATLVIAAPDAHRDPVALARLFRERGVTTAHFVPSMLAAFLADPAVRGLAIKRVFCSGEELPADLRERFHATLHGELHNLYGPTEAAVDVSYWPASAQDRSRPVPIGFPVWNTRLYVLDAQLRPLPPGVAGDLYLGGVQLARGYLGRPDLTADRFLADPFLPGERIYRTGDLARWREDGAVVFLGRSDDQVKLRGLRIELGEIEAALAGSGLVERAGVVVREDRPGDRRIVAYVRPGAGYDLHALRTHVAAHVPDYMVPAAFVALDDWPVNANGKLDRKALPAPDYGSAGRGGRALQTATEHTLAVLFAEVLGLAEVPDADADFFALGGDSLLAVQLLLRIQQQWQRDPGLGALFSTPSVSGLAAVLDAGDTGFDSGLAPSLRLLDGGNTLAPLFVIHPAGGIGWGYRHLARALSPRRTVHALQAPALDLQQPIPAGIDALAADYAARIVATSPQGPYHLAGWSVGGIIAQAVAARLQADGHAVGLVALLDAYPSECWRAEPEPTPVMALRALLAIAGYDPDAHPELDSRDAIVDFLRRGDSALGNLPQAALEGVIRVVTDTNRLIRQHHHTRWPGTLTHIRAGLDHAGRNLQGALWAPHAGTLDLLEVPFLHAHMTGPEASALIAPLLDARLAAWDAAGTVINEESTP